MSAGAAATVSRPRRIPTEPRERRFAAAIPDYGCDINCVLQLNGRIDAVRLADAVQRVLAIEPIWNYRYVDSGWRPYWEPVPDADRFGAFRCTAGGDPEQHTADFIHALPERGLQVCLVSGPHDRVCIKVDHRLGDGTATRLLVHELVDVYNRLAAGQTEFPSRGIRERSVRLLRQRFSRQERWRYFKEFLKTARQLNRGGQWRFPPPASLEDAAPMALVKFAGPELARLQQFALQQRSTPVQVIVAATFLALCELAPQPDALPRPISLAVDLRRYLPNPDAVHAACLAGSAVLWLEPGRYSTLTDALQTIREQLQTMRGAQFGLALSESACDVPIVSQLLALPPQRNLKRWVRRSVQNPQRSGFVLVTDMGRYDAARLKFGDVETTDLYCVGGRLSVPGIILVGACQFEQTLSVVCGYGPRAFVDRLQRRLRELLTV